MNRAISKKLSILLLSMMLSLPGFVIANHIHETSVEELSCEFGSHSGGDAAVDHAQNDFFRAVASNPQSAFPRLVATTESLHKDPRGPPLRS